MGWRQVEDSKRKLNLCKKTVGRKYFNPNFES